MPRARAAWALTTAGRRSASTRTTPQEASSKRASLRAMERSRSICAWTSLKAQYRPAGLPSGPRTAADWVRTRTRPPSFVTRANSWTCRPHGVHGGHQPPLDLLGVGGAYGPPGESAASYGLPHAPAQDAFGLAVPVGDDAVGVERAQGRVHPVQQGGEEIRATGVRGALGAFGVLGVHRALDVLGVLVRRTGPLGLVGSELVGGPTTPGSTHLNPLQAAVASACTAGTARRFARSPSFNSNVTQPTSGSRKMRTKSLYAGFPPHPSQRSHEPGCSVSAGRRCGRRTPA